MSSVANTADLMSALASAAAGSTVTIEPGFYQPPDATALYPWTIPAGVTLQGAAGDKKSILTGGVQMHGARATISDCEIISALDNGIDCQADLCLINACEIHDCFQGIGAWLAATQLIIQDCVLHSNGAAGHGHNIYLQNAAGTGPKTIQRCVLAAGESPYSLHCYGEQAGVCNVEVLDCDFIGGNNLIGGFLPGSGYKISGCQFLDATLLIGWSGVCADVEVSNCSFYGQNALNVRQTVDVQINECQGPAFNVSYPAGVDPKLAGAGNVWWLGGNVMGIPAGWAFPQSVATYNTNPAPVWMTGPAGNRWFIDQDPRYRGWLPGPKLTPPTAPADLQALAAVWE